MTMTTTNADGGEEVLVLYGSQTGNSEGAAERIRDLLPSRLRSDGVPCHARLLQLDDFLELERAAWTRLVVIVCSSYGVGQAPLGARKFREACDAILENKEEGGNFLRGVKFALLGLGDSHYTTFFRNPTVIHDALTKAGAVRVGALGKADASGTGDDEQSKVVERWIDGVWDDLAEAATEPPPRPEILEEAREKTWELCVKLNPDWKGGGNGTIVNYVAAVGGVGMSMAIYLYLKGGGTT